MTKEETLALFAQGRDAWNAWAEGMLAERGGMEKVAEEWAEAARADFSEHEFEESDQFHGLLFPGEVWFQGATFRGLAWFKGATFRGMARFDGATFRGMARFGQTLFKGFTSFENSRFEAQATFVAIEVTSAFTMVGATFLQVPDFNQAHFAEAPRLDTLRIEPGGF